MSEWQPIETAPRKFRDNPRAPCGPIVLLGSTSGHLALGYWREVADDAGNWYGVWCNIHDHRPISYWNALTHWMEAPAPPEPPR